MPKRRSLARRALLLIVIILLAGLIAVWMLLRASVPRLDG